MEFKNLINDDDAVSPVIGVILMVAITVILAAVIGTFVLGLGDQVQTTAPNAQFSFDFENGATEDTLKITHDGGDGVEAGEVSVRGDVTDPGLYSDEAGYGATSKIRAGTSVTIDGTTAEYQWAAGGNTVDRAPEDAEIRVVWQDSDSDQSSTLRTWTKN